jgi:hypothetical protein
LTLAAGRRYRRAGVLLAVLLPALAAAWFLIPLPGRDPPDGSGPQAPGPAASPVPGSLLAEVLEAHGGLKRWQELQSLRLRIRFGGLAFSMRFAEPDTAPRWIDVSLTEPRVVFDDFPLPGQRGVFTPDRVWIETDRSELLRERRQPRRVLLESRRRQIWWDDLDLLYFAGYASWNYFQGPFLLIRDGVETQEIEPWRQGGETWRRLAVRFHDSIPTHSREQVFYYDAGFRQRRHDYRPDVYASWAHAAHFTHVYRAFGGLQMPTRREVFPRGEDGRAASRPLLVWIDLLDVQF